MIMTYLGTRESDYRTLLTECIRNVVNPVNPRTANHLVNRPSLAIQFRWLYRGLATGYQTYRTP